MIKFHTFQPEERSTIVHLCVYDSKTDELLYGGQYKGNNVPLSQELRVKSLEEKYVDIYVAVWESGQYNKLGTVIYNSMQI